MRAPLVLGIARAEARSIRRSFRFWLFAGLTAFTGLSSYLYYAVLHGLFSSWTPTLGVLAPRYVAPAVGLWCLIAMSAAAVLLACDLRARDERCGIQEVLDTRSHTTAELVVGRFAALLAATWLALVAVMVLLQAVGLLGRLFAWPVAEPLQASSLVAFLLPAALPALGFVLALTLLLAAAVRSRALIAAVAFVVLAVASWAVLQAPLARSAGFDVLGIAAVASPSDLVPGIVQGVGLAQRLALSLAAAGLLALAIRVHPRPDDPSRRTVPIAATLLTLAVVGVLAIAWRGEQRLSRFERWRDLHARAADGPRADLRSIAGVVDLDPGSRLALDLELTFRAPAGAPLERAVLTLNPGLRVREIADPDGRHIAFEQADGLVTVELEPTLAAGDERRLRLVAAGAPDLDFAYLDAPVHPATLGLAHPRRLLLGSQPAFFSDELVALLPGIHWLPTPGSAASPSLPRDFFTLDLTVLVPAGWSVAGPGRARTVNAARPDGRSTVRFSPGAPLPEVALVAGALESRSFEVEGVEVALLYHPAHARNVELFAAHGGAIRQAVAAFLRDAAELGVPYPYDGLTAVEVPRSLRAYGGGWRMESALAPAGLLLMREDGFFAARFERRLEESVADLTGELRPIDVLSDFFASDFGGGNVFDGAAKNLFAAQVSGRTARVDALCARLVRRLSAGEPGYFTALAFDARINTLIGETIGYYTSPPAEPMSLAAALRRSAVDRPEVWESLASVEPWPPRDAEAAKRAYDAMMLRSDSLARLLVEGLGRRRVGALVAGLRRAHRGGSFALGDLIAEAREAGMDAAALESWLAGRSLPGFVTSIADTSVLPPGRDGRARHQLTVHVLNRESAPGFVGLRYVAAAERDWQTVEPVRVAAGSAVEIGIVTAEPVRRLVVDPYLSLNRHAFEVHVAAVGKAAPAGAAEPFVGVRDSDWSPEGHAVVVDDLDPGFSIRPGGGTDGGRADGPHDAGLPVHSFGAPPAAWSRKELPRAWGRYRHTAAVAEAGGGESAAVFTAELPASGRWRLELHVVDGAAAGGLRFAEQWRLGQLRIQIEDGSGGRSVLFEADGAHAGWNEVAELELASGEVTVALSDRTDGTFVVADAIRWQPLAGGARPVPMVAEAAAAALDAGSR